MSSADKVDHADRLVVVVTGTGRTGTSTLAGVLGLLGPRVPRPHLKADAKTEQPTYESQWVANHHADMMRRDPVVRAFDSRPESAELARSLVTADDVTAADLWLGGVLHDAPTGQVVLHESRIFWFHDQWTDVAERLSARVAAVTLLEHPARFIRSRDALGAPEDQDPRLRRQRDTAFLAGWVHALLVIEEVTRRHDRVLVRREDLAADWRAVAARLGDRLGLRLDLEGADGTTGVKVDELVALAPDLGPTDWDDVDVPDALREVAVALWDLLDGLVDAPADGATDDTLPDRVEALRDDYVRVFDHALGVTTDHLATREVHVSRRARAAADRDYEAQIAELEQQLEEARNLESDGPSELPEHDVDERPRRRWFG